MPNMVVYPGGLSEPCDFSTEWLKICSKFGEYSVHKDAKFPDIMLNDSSDPLKVRVSYMRLTVESVVVKPLI